MSQWNETLEPYVKVTETVRSSALNVSAGESLIIGVTLISDSGPSVPTLISSQSEFIKTYASKDLTKDYVKSLDKLYTGDNKTLASTMWLNAYRLAGSNTLLVYRACKAGDINFAKPLVKNDQNTYILRDGVLLKKLPSFKIVLDIDGDEENHDTDGWSMNVNGVGIFGNRTTDNGPQYDYFVNSLPELVDQLNDTSKFFSPDYKFYSDDKATVEVDSSSEDIISVVFNEVYVGETLLDTSDSVRCPDGLQFLVICEPDWTSDNPSQKVIEINSSAWSGFDVPEYYAYNKYNSSNDIRLRIRRFNHDAVVSKEITETTLSDATDSPWKVLTSVLDTFTAKGTKEPAASILERDFYEVAVLDPGISEEPMYFNLGNIVGRGDMTEAELNDSLSMLQVQLPDNLRDLDLNYYGYDTDNNYWKEIPESDLGEEEAKKTVDSYEALLKENGMVVGDIYKVGTDPYKYYKYTSNGEDQVFVKLGIDPAEYRILDVSDTDLKNGLDEIGKDEIYVTEGLCDLGNTEPSFQNYMANMAINENYFYPISTVYSTNYMTIANSASKVPQDSYKLYLSAPWDIDTGTVGWNFDASPSVLYWEAVARNKRNNSEFAPILGQTTGVVQYQRPVVEFNKKTRQLLLTKKINTVLWNNQTSAWNMNDNYTKQSVTNIMSDEGNSRLAIRISKSMPVILKQFIGWKINARLWESATSVIDYWFKDNILPMLYSVSDYVIQIDDSNNPLEIQRQSKMVVSIRVRYLNSLKYIEVYHDIFDVGADITGEM